MGTRKGHLAETGRLGNGIDRRAPIAWELINWDVDPTCSWGINWSERVWGIHWIIVDWSLVDR